MAVSDTLVAVNGIQLRKSKSNAQVGTRGMTIGVEKIVDLSGRQRRKHIMSMSVWQHTLNDTYEMTFLVRQMMLTQGLAELRLAQCLLDYDDIKVHDHFLGLGHRTNRLKSLC